MEPNVTLLPPVLAAGIQGIRVLHGNLADRLQPPGSVAGRNRFEKIGNASSCRFVMPFLERMDKPMIQDYARSG